MTMASPDSTIPSTGITLPIWTATRSPTRILEIGTKVSVPSSHCQTFSIFKDILPARSLTDFLWVHSSRISPIPSRNVTELAVPKSRRSMEIPMAAASRTSTASFPLKAHLAPRNRNGTAVQAVWAARTGKGRNSRVNSFTKIFPTSFS